MKKLFVGIVVFITTFILGYATAYFFVPRLEDTKDRSFIETSTVGSATRSSTAADIANSTDSASATDQLETIDEVKNLSLAELSKYPVRLLEIGEGYPDGQVKIKNGQKWLGLFPKDGEYVLRWTKIKVTLDGPASAHDDSYLWHQVTVPDKTQPIFMTRNASMLHPGKVTTAFRGLDNASSEEMYRNGINISDSFTTLSNGFYQNFLIAEESSILTVEEAKNRDGQPMLALVLIKGDTRQVLFTDASTYSQDLGQLYWVGDLDGDGKVDIYCELNDGGTSALFLSSQAEKGKLVKRVAGFYWDVGC